MRDPKGSYGLTTMKPRGAVSSGRRSVLNVVYIRPQPGPKTEIRRRWGKFSICLCRKLHEFLSLLLTASNVLS